MIQNLFVHIWINHNDARSRLLENSLDNSKGRVDLTLGNEFFDFSVLSEGLPFYSRCSAFCQLYPVIWVEKISSCRSNESKSHQLTPRPNQRIFFISCEVLT